MVRLAFLSCYSRVARYAVAFSGAFSGVASCGAPFASAFARRVFSAVTLASDTGAPSVAFGASVAVDCVARALCVAPMVAR